MRQLERRGLTSGHESEQLHHTWTAVTNCSGPPGSGFTFDHYETCHRKGVDGSDPAAPTVPYVCYSDDGSPGSWEDCVEIVMGFQGAITWDSDPTDYDATHDPDPNGCVGDTQMFAYLSGGTRHGGGFTNPEVSDGYCFDAGPDPGLSSAGPIFIEHVN